MPQNAPSHCPFTTAILDDPGGSADALPATYHFYEFDSRNKKRRNVADPTTNVRQFLDAELSLGDLDGMMRHLWFAGAKHPATQLHFQVAMGREITVADRMDLHLLWDNEAKIFLKPLPRFLVDRTFWQDNLTCPHVGACAAQSPPDPAAPCRKQSRSIALGFLYTYACLVSSESDFFVANEKRLLPRRGDNDATIPWATWKQLVRELSASHDPAKVHERFRYGELRLSRINTIHRFTRLPLFDPYLRGWRNYGSLFRDNLVWMSAATIYIALVLTAMQVGLATERLQVNVLFQRVSYGFTIFAIVGPLCVSGLVLLGALYNLVKDLPWVLRGRVVGTSRGTKDGLVGSKV